MIDKHIPEAFYHFIWKYRLLSPNLETIAGKKLIIIHPGMHNSDAGPDFLCAKVRIGDTLWVGNVEIHVKSSDWNKHAHEKDMAYGNIILHVVAHYDKAVKDVHGRRLQTLILDGFFDESLLSRYKEISHNLLWVPCMNLIQYVSRIEVTARINALAVERLEEKSKTIREQLMVCNMDWEECCYRLIAKHFGARINTDAFEMLAKTLPVKILMKYHGKLFQLEALLFGQSGLMNTPLRSSYPRAMRKEYAYLSAKHRIIPMPGYIWNFLRLRPASFPSLRIAQLARMYEQHQAVLQELLEIENLQSLVKFFHLQASEYWDTHYLFDRKSLEKKKIFGKQSIHLLLINGIIPLMFLYGKEMNKTQLCDRAISFLESLPPENNAIIRRWKSCGVEANNALESQGLLQLRNTRCSNKLCLECNIGYHLLKFTVK